MARYCKICGAKSGRCNHIVLEMDKKGPDSDERKNSKPDK